MTKPYLTKQIWKNIVVVNPTAKQMTLIMMDDFLLFTFMSTEGIIANKDVENMFIGNMVGIIFSRKNQKWAKFFHHLTLVTVHISYLNEAKHQACQDFQRLIKLIVNLNHSYKFVVEEEK